MKLLEKCGHRDTIKGSEEVTGGQSGMTGGSVEKGSVRSQEANEDSIGFASRRREEGCPRCASQQGMMERMGSRLGKPKNVAARETQYV